MRAQRKLAQRPDLLTLAETGERLGVSHERVRQIENRALSKLCAGLLGDEVVRQWARDNGVDPETTP